MESLSEGPGVLVRIAVAWGDMDALGHVNNTVFLRWFESARIAWWERIAADGLGERSLTQGVGPILARTTIDYRRPVRYPDTIEVRITTRRVGGKSTTLAYELRSSAQGGAVVAEGDTVLDLYDYRSGSTVPIDDALRAAMLGGPAAAGS